MVTLPGTVELTVITIAAMLPFPKNITAPKVARRFSKLAIVIPAHNESSTILQCLNSLRNCDPLGHGPDITVVVIADNCTDSTAELASSAGATTIVRSDASRQGKGFVLQDGFATLMACGFDAFVVLDADTVVEPNFLREITAQLDAGADAVQVRYLARNPHQSLYSRLSAIGLMAINGMRPVARSRLGLSAGLVGNGFALSKDTLIAVPFTSSSIVEDLEYHLNLVRAGKIVAFARHTTVRADLPVAGDAAARQHSRWEGGRLRLARENTIPLLSELVGGHLTLLEPLLDLLTLPLSFQLVLLTTIFLAGSATAKLYTLAAFAIVSAHVAVAAMKANGEIWDLALLPLVPLYIVWKLLIATRIVTFSRREAKWLRTQRAEVPSER